MRMAAVRLTHCELHTATNILSWFRPGGGNIVDRSQAHHGEMIILTCPHRIARAICNNMIIMRLSKCVPIMRCVRVRVCKYRVRVHLSRAHAGAPNAVLNVFISNTGDAARQMRSGPPLLGRFAYARVPTRVDSAVGRPQHTRATGTL